MKIAIISIALIAMTLVSTEALTLHSRGFVSAGSCQGKNDVDTSLFHTVKRTTPDYSSSALTTLRDRLVTKRHDKRGTESKPTKEPIKQSPVYTCQEYIDGIESVLVSLKVSMDKVRKEVNNRNPSEDVLAKLKEIDGLLTQTRRDTKAAKKTKYKTKKTMDTLVSTATGLHTKLSGYMDPLEETKSGAYEDLMMHAGNIESYAKEYIKNGCVAGV